MNSKLTTLALISAFSSAVVFAQSAPTAKPTHRERAMQHIKAADTDGNGQISRSEAEKSFPHMNRQFEALDTNHDGQLSPDEMQAGHQSKRQQRQAHSGEGKPRHNPFARVDSNRDGVVSRQELETADLSKPDAKRHLQTVFEAADADKDGLLTQAEQEAFHKARRAHAKPGKPSVPAN